MENLEVICRVCLKIYSDHPESLTLIFQEALNRLNLIEKIFVISGVLIIDDDLMPKKICHDCINNVNNAYMVRELIIKSDKFLQQINSVEFAVSKEELVLEVNNEGNLIEEEYREEYLDEFIVNTTDNEFTNENSSKRINPREPCYICAKLISKRNMHLHLKTHSLLTESYICDLCGEAFRLKPYLFSHIENRHKTRKFQCQCGKAYNKKNTYEAHLKTHTGINLDSFKCKFCTKSFALHNRLKVL